MRPRCPPGRRRRAGNEEVRAGFADLGRVGLPDPAVHLHMDSSGSKLAEAAHAAERLRHERLSRIPGVDTHAEDEVGKLTRDRDDVVRLGFRVERNACAEAELARLTDHACRSSQASKCTVTLSPPASAICRVLSGVSTIRWQSSTHRTGGRSAKST